MVDPAANCALMIRSDRGVIADGGIGNCQHSPGIIGNATAIEYGSIITNKAVPNIEGPGVVDATTGIAGPVIRHGTMVDGQCGLVIKDAAPGRRTRGHVPTTNGDALDGDSVAGQDVKDAELRCGWRSRDA